MSKLLLLVLLLSVGTLSYNNYNRCDSPICKPAVKVKNCYQAFCYRCNLNEIFNENSLLCECAPGFFNINGYCGKCRDGTKYDPVKYQCDDINPCPINQQLVGGVCKCLPGLVVIQNVCQSCPTNMTYFPEFDACRCRIGFTLIQGRCILIDCLLNEVYSVDAQACVCAQGFVRLLNVTDNTTYCGQCRMSEQYDAVTRSCKPIVQPECGFHEYAYENCCYCQIGYVRIGQYCVTCPRNSFYDWNTDSCICFPGYYFVGEEVKQIPYQQLDFGSSFILNPSRAYSYKGPYNGVPIQEPIIVVGSNYDGSHINTNGPNIGNVYNVPPINSRR